MDILSLAGHGLNGLNGIGAGLEFRSRQQQFITLFHVYIQIQESPCSTFFGRYQS